MPYHFVVAEIPHKESGSWVLGDELGEVRKLANGTSRNLHLPLNGLPTADFVLRMDDPLASQITDRSGDVLLKIYRDSTLTFIGQATLVSEEGEEDGRHTLACNFAGPLWVLGKRLFAKSVAGYETTGTAAQTLITNLIALTNEEHDTGIRGGTLDSLYAVPYAQTHYKPINELITEIQAAKVPFPVVIPPAYVGRDTMTDTANVALTAHTPETGGAWTGAGDATDFTVLGTTEDVANRQEVSDASAVAGRWAISGAANQTDVLVGVDWQTSVAGASGHNVFGGVFARYTDQNNWLLAYYNLNTNQIGLDKKVAGTQTTIGTYTFPSGGFTTAPDWYSIRLLVDQYGNFTVWHYATSVGLDAPKISGRDTDLATGGTLATGKVGFYDAYTGITAGTSRSYDNFLASAYTGPQSFDFQIVPSEPTADVDGVQVGTIDIETQIGTSKPEVVFEYGGGNRSASRYKRVFNRDRICTQAFSLPPGFPDPGTDVRSHTEATAIDERGLFEEVLPEDFGRDETLSSQLRQAWVEANAQIRSTAPMEVEFTPSANGPTFGTDYIVGDYVTARAIVNGTMRFNGLIRIQGVDISIDENGKVIETPKLTTE